MVAPSCHVYLVGLGWVHGWQDVGVPISVMPPLGIVYPHI